MNLAYNHSDHAQHMYTATVSSQQLTAIASLACGA